MLLDFRRPPYYIQESFRSWSGKYMCFLGHHYHQGVLCYVVGTSNATSGEIVCRHYNEKQQGTLNQDQAKAYALAYWHEFKQTMQRAPLEEETNESRKDLEIWFEKADAVRSRRRGN